MLICHNFAMSETNLINMWKRNIVLLSVILVSMHLYGNSTNNQSFVIVEDGKFVCSI